MKSRRQQDFLWLSLEPSSGSYLPTVLRVAQEQKLRPYTSCSLEPESKLRPDRIDCFYEPQTWIEGDLQQMPSDFPVVDLWRVLAGSEEGR